MSRMVRWNRGWAGVENSFIPSLQSGGNPLCSAVPSKG